MPRWRGLLAGRAQRRLPPDLNASWLRGTTIQVPHPRRRPAEPRLARRLPRNRGSRSTVRGTRIITTRETRPPARMHSSATVPPDFGPARGSAPAHATASTAPRLAHPLRHVRRHHVHRPAGPRPPAPPATAPRPPLPPPPVRWLRVHRNHCWHHRAHRLHLDPPPAPPAAPRPPAPPPAPRPP